MIGETREAIEAYCVAVGLVVYEWNDLHEKLAGLFALVRGGDRQETLTEWYAIRSDTKQREKLRCAIIETTSDRWKKSPRAPDDLKWLLDRTDKLAGDRNNAIHAPCSLYLYGHTLDPDGTVRANVVTLAPDVAGQVVQLPVKDNQFVHKGTS
jgi:Biotin-lipoyl like